MERLTEKTYCGYDIANRQDYNGYDNESNFKKIFSCLQKLGKLEDLMEKYDIKDLTELESVIVNNGTGEQAFKEFYEQNIKPYKDIEQELGIELSVLFNAVKNEIYYTKNALVLAPDCLKENVIYKVKNEDVHIELGGSENKCSVGISVYVLKRNCYYYLKPADYGKTWALTKEELE